MKEKENLSDVKVHYYEGNEIFISGIQGKEVRKNVITICKRCMETAEERILIGNGFQDLNQKEENRKTSTIRI